jgi:hypothetical protein
MDVCVSSVGTLDWILFMFGIEEFIHNLTVPSEYEHASFKNRDSSEK